MIPNFGIKEACKIYFTQCTIILGPRVTVMAGVSLQTEQRLQRGNGLLFYERKRDELYETRVAR